MMAPVLFGSIRTTPIPHQCANFPCIIQNIQSPSRFWVRVITPAIQSQEARLQILLQDIYGPLLLDTSENDPEQTVNLRNFLIASDHFLQEGNPQDLAEEIKEIVGDYAVTFDPETNSFSRILLIDYNSKYELFRALEIDTGYGVEVPVHQILPMVEDISKFPSFSICCHLHNIYPRGSRSGEPMPDWSATAIEGFRIISKTAPSWTMDIKEPNSTHPSGSLPVILHRKNHCGDSDSVNKVLQRLRLGTAVEPPPTMNENWKKRMIELNENIKNS